MNICPSSVHPYGSLNCFLWLAQLFPMALFEYTQRKFWPWHMLRRAMLSWRSQVSSSGVLACLTQFSLLSRSTFSISRTIAVCALISFAGATPRCDLHRGVTAAHPTQREQANLAYHPLTHAHALTHVQHAHTCDEAHLRRT